MSMEYCHVHDEMRDTDLEVDCRECVNDWLEELDDLQKAQAHLKQSWTFRDISDPSFYKSITSDSWRAQMAINRKRIAELQKWVW